MSAATTELKDTREYVLFIIYFVCDAIQFIIVSVGVFKYPQEFFFVD